MTTRRLVPPPGVDRAAWVEAVFLSNAPLTENETVALAAELNRAVRLDAEARAAAEARRRADAAQVRAQRARDRLATAGGLGNERKRQATARRGRRYVTWAKELGRENPTWSDASIVAYMRRNDARRRPKSTRPRKTPSARTLRRYLAAAKGE